MEAKPYHVDLFEHETNIILFKEVQFNTRKLDINYKGVIQRKKVKDFLRYTFDH